MDIFSLRYGHAVAGSREYLMKACGFLQHKKVITVRSDAKLCKKILEASVNKGSFIESLIACPAWQPIYSIESVDGKLWRDLADSFSQVYKNLDWHTHLSQVVHEQLSLLQERKPKSVNEIDGADISRWTVSIFFKLIFARSLTIDEQNLYYLASLEWRKEIAMKGKGNIEIKKQFYEHLERELKTSSIFHCFDDHDTFSEEVFRKKLSVIAQPFMISPQINFSDVFASLFSYVKSDLSLQTILLKSVATKDFKTLGFFILETLRLHHPFPVLERELEDDFSYKSFKCSKGTQVFILLDSFNHTKDFSIEPWQSGEYSAYKSLLFGAGKRICAGKHIALHCLSYMLIEMIKHYSLETIKPYHNHFYSGRTNDQQDSKAMIFYQCKTAGKILWQSFKLGLQGRS